MQRPALCLVVALACMLPRTARAARGGTSPAVVPAGRITQKMVRMTVFGMSHTKGGYVVVLHHAGAAKKLPIWIGPRQARAIAIKHAHAKTPRPMTHDLLQRVITTLGARIERLEISDLRHGIFIGRLLLRTKLGARRVVDARPSDLIVLGVANRLPIHVAQHVIDQAGARISPGKSSPRKGPPKKAPTKP
ncbi:MAG: bifunctional nuclease family protein [Myxococcales bacterium]|nr:bifunctional nuclease family protein [Myxococcales bacterium]